MRNRFARVLCGLAAALAVTMATGLTVAGSASAATHHVRPNAIGACSGYCYDLSSLLLGPQDIMTADVPGGTGTGGKAGQELTLKFASNSNPNQDFTDYLMSAGRPETVATFCAAWPAPQSFSPLSYVCQFYGDLPVYEFSWSPFGNESGLCAGVARAGVDGENVTLQNCGDSDNTLWIPDGYLCPGNLRPQPVVKLGKYCPGINGGDTNFSDPLVLTVNAGSSNPANQLIVERLHLLAGGVVPDSQLITLTRALIPGPPLPS
jgi:hypothetical protein